MKKLERSIDYVKSVDKITGRISKDLKKDLFLQGDLLNSKYKDISFESLEKNLNDFYVDLRLLEEIKEYTKVYIEKEIIQKSSKCKGLLKEIEDIRDMAKKEGYISINVPLRLRNEVYKDRDGKTLEKCHVKDQVLTISGNEIDNIKIKNIELNSYGNIPYKNNIKDSILIDKEYRSFYLLDGPVQNGLKEEITLTFDKPTKVNYVNIESNNCEILRVTFIDSSNRESTEDYNPPIKEDRIAKEIKILLNTNNYEQRTYNIDKNRTDPDFWTKVKVNEFAIMNNKEPLFDLDTIAGLDQYRKDYDIYIEELKIWENEKNEIEEINKKRKVEYNKELKNYEKEYNEYNRNR